MVNRIWMLSLALVVGGSVCLWSMEGPGQKAPALPPSAKYLGQVPPGDTPVAFAPDLLAPKGEFVGNASFTPDGSEFYYTVTNGLWSAFELRFTQFKDGKWTTPAKPAFVEHPLSFEPTVAQDGQRIYFTSGSWSDLDIWFCDRMGEAWGKPARLAEAIGAPAMKMFSSISRKGTLFFGMVDDSGGRTYCATSKGKTWNPAAAFSAHFNEPKQIGDPFISPDEDYLIFLAERPGGYGQADLYITFSKGHGDWTHPKNLGPKINTDAFEFGPSLTPDGKYFMFSRRKAWKTEVPSQIFWVKADFIEQLRHTNFAPYLHTPIPDQAAAVGKELQFTIPGNTFIDDDGNSTLSYSATLEKGEPLPSWLSFTPGTQTFSGTPTQPGKLRLEVLAADPSGAAASAHLTVEIR